MSTQQIPFNAKICFTGAPESGLNEIAARIHSVTQVATGCRIPFFDLGFWIHPESAYLRDDLRRSQEMLLVADTILGAYGPRGEEQSFYLVQGPVDALTLAAMQNISLPPEISKTCSRVVERIHLLVFQLPDRDGWRAKGFDEPTVAWFANYTKMLFKNLRNLGLRLEQFRVLSPPIGDESLTVHEACFDVFGVAPHPLKPSEKTEPLAFAVRAYQAECREVFEANEGSIFGVPRKMT